MSFMLNNRSPSCVYFILFTLSYCTFYLISLGKFAFACLLENIYNIKFELVLFPFEFFHISYINAKIKEKEKTYMQYIEDNVSKPSFILSLPKILYYYAGTDNYFT